MGKSWKNPHKLAKAQARGQVFTKLAREIQVAAKLGGPDPAGNSRLKIAIDAARAESCPKDTIERAIRKGAGLDGGALIEELTYEGVGPFGVGILIECQTDNKNRTVSDLRTLFRRHDCNLGEGGSVAWMFDRAALVTGKKANVGDPEEEAIEASANSVEKNEDGSYSFYGAKEDLDAMRSSLIARGWTIDAAELSYLPKNLTDITEDQLKLVRELLEAIDELDDTHRVHATIK